MKLLVVQFSPLPCYLVPLRPKYPPQHPILERSQSTHIKNKQDYISAFLNLYISGYFYFRSNV